MNASSVSNKQKSRHLNTPYVRGLSYDEQTTSLPKVLRLGIQHFPLKRELQSNLIED